MSEPAYRVLEDFQGLHAGRAYPASVVRDAAGSQARAAARSRFTTACISLCICLVGAAVSNAVLTIETSPWLMTPLLGGTFLAGYMAYSRFGTAFSASRMNSDQATAMLIEIGSVTAEEEVDILLDEARVLADAGQTIAEIAAHMQGKGMSSESARKLAKFGTALRNISEIKESTDAGWAVQAVLTGATPPAIDGSMHEPTLPSELHLAASLSRRERRDLFHLARGIRRHLEAGCDLREVQNRLASRVAESSAGEFIDMAAAARRCLDSGIDYSALEASGFEVRSEADGKALNSAAMGELFRGDARFHVLYLRSHRDDSTIVQDDGAIFRKRGGTRAQSYEMTIFPLIWKKVGPVYAVRGPEDELENCIIPRIDTSVTGWKPVVLHLMITAGLVVIRMNETPGVVWEAQKALGLVRVERIVLAFPDVAEMVGGKERWRQLCRPFLDACQNSLPGNVDISNILDVCPLFVGFGLDGNPLLFSSDDPDGSYFRVCRALEALIERQENLTGFDFQESREVEDKQDEMLERVRRLISPLGER